MPSEGPTRFDAGDYWRDRVRAGSDLTVVGHRSLGAEYNAVIYERRIEALTAQLARHVPGSPASLRILDVGCGSGFYTGYWQSLGVASYVGLDISPRTIGHLAQAFRGYRFEQADVTADATDADAALRGESFDLVTVFDVFYHIVDNARFEAAVRNVARAVARGGTLLVMDQLASSEYRLSRHVVFRARAAYLDTMAANGLELIEAEPLFHFLTPPLAGNRVVDTLAAAAFKLAGGALRVVPRASRWVAERLRSRDTRLRAAGRRVSNSELLVFRKR